MGEVVTFYSYRGGVGRTMALAHTASLLAEWGYKTLVIDWDLAAPGLESYFKNYIDVGKVARGGGVADLLDAAMRGLPAAHGEAKRRAPDSNGNGNGSGRGSRAEPPPDWRDLVVPVPYLDGRGNLDMLTAGRRDEHFYGRVRGLDVQSLYRRRGGYFIERWREQWKEAYDFVLVDCPAGVSDLGAICTVQLADILVLMLSTTRHSIANAVEVTRRVTEARARLPLDRLHLLTIPVLGRVDEEHINDEMRSEWLKEVEREVSEFYDDWLPTFFPKRYMLSLTKISNYKRHSMEDQWWDMSRRGEIEISRAFETIAALIARGLDDLHELHKNRAAYVSKANRSPSPKRNGQGTLSPQDVRRQHELWLDTHGREGAQGDFSKRKLYEENFSRANLERALFIGADLNKVVLSGANLRGANLTDALLSDVKLDGANLTRASLNGARLHDVNGFKAKLFRAELKGTSLSESQFARADFRRANLLGSKLIKTDMSGARFVEANLSKVDFEGAQMLNADLSRATITEPLNWTLPQFGGANLSGATVSEEISKELTGGEGLQRARRHAVRFQLYLFGLLAASAHVLFVALFATADATLLKNAGLGGLGAWMPARFFFMLVPAELLALYFLLHLSLHNLHARVAALPETYPGGRTSGEEVTNRYLRAALQPDAEPRPRPWHTAVVFLARWFVPATLFLVWLRSLPLRDRTLTSVQLLLLVASVFAAALLSRWRDTPAGGAGRAND